MISLSQELKKGTSRYWFSIFLVAIVLLVQSCASKSDQIDKELLKTASELNRSLPAMVDNMTRLDNVSAMPGKTIQYNYSIITDQQLDYNLLKKNLTPTLVNNMKTHPDMKSFRDNSVKVVYSYKDGKGNFLFKIDIGPDQYK